MNSPAWRALAAEPGKKKAALVQGGRAKEDQAFITFANIS
jgi:hypothetical protein